MIAILKNLGAKLGFNVEIPSSQSTLIQENQIQVEKEIGATMKSHRANTIRAKHYCFINFQKYGVKWNPDWFSMVRDPVERVSLLDITYACKSTFATFKILTSLEIHGSWNYFLLE